jgi:ribose/xylose/arabinose/galactoside ABC-type transport system permease subunit
MTSLSSPPTGVIPRHQNESRARSLLSAAAIPLVLLVIVSLGALVSPRFLTVANLVNVLNSAAIIGIAAVGMTVVLLVGGFVDLSMPATLATAGIVTLLVGSVLPAPLAVAVGVASAAIAGLVNGLLIGWLGLNPVIATLGTNVVILGIAQALIGGQIIYTPFDESVKQAVTASYYGVPFAVLVLVLVAVTVGFVLSATTFGRKVYATGGNPNAALIAGVGPRRVTTIVFVISAACAGLAGSILALQLGTVRPGIGAGYEFDAVTAVVIGGTSLFGGAGSVTRTMGGLLVVGLTTNVLALVGVPTPAQGLIKGGVIVGAVALDVATRVRSKR